MNDDTSMRDEFEAWAISMALSVATLDRFTQYPKGTYEDSRVHASWQGWQAAWNRRTDTRAAALDAGVFAIAVTRAVTFEEAARVCEARYDECLDRESMRCAEEIRALAAKTTEG